MALLLLGLLPFMLRLTQLYDMPTLALWAGALAALASGREGLYLALYVLACLNRETAILLAVIYVLDRGINIVLGAQVAIYAAAHGAIVMVMANRPGSVFEFHLLDHWPAMATNIELTMLYLLLAGIAAAAMLYRFGQKPVLLRVALLTIMPVLLIGYLIVGYPFEFRVFYEAYPALVFLALWPIIPHAPAQSA